MDEAKKSEIQAALVAVVRDNIADHPELNGAVVSFDDEIVTPAGANRIHVTIDEQMFVVLCQAED